ncbi:MAG: GspE/PulE family protein [Phycisphaerales bacterium]
MPNLQASPRFMELIPREFAREHLVLGESVLDERDPADGLITLAHGPATDPLILHNVQARLGVATACACADAESLARRIDEAYAAREAREPDHAHAARADREGIPTIEIGSESAASAGGSADLDEELQRLAANGERDLLSLSDKGPVIRLVDSILFDAIGRGGGASDIHIQPLADCTLIRFRVDGVLLTARRVSPRLAPAIVSRIKVMARLDVAERRAPQDGRATVTIGRAGHRGGSGAGGSEARAIDLRIATLPSAYGERVVIRLLDTQQGRSLSSLDGVGMPPDVASAYRDRASRSSGIVLVTGPTGSGKTTTLYATLRWIAAHVGGAGAGTSRATTGGTPVNILTIEDPIEYDLSSLNETPDIRTESQDASAESGDTGAGVSSLAPQAPPPRLAPSLPISQTQVDPRKNLTFATGLRHILRQDPDVIMVGEIRDLDTARIAIQASLTGHLVFSTLHTADAPGAVTRLLDLGIEPYLVASSLSCVLAQRLVRLTHQPCSGAGCADCLHSGFKGRRGIFELLVIDSTIREMISCRASATAIRDAAIALPAPRGMKRLEDQGAELTRAGLTTLDEVRRVTLGTEG